MCYLRELPAGRICAIESARCKDAEARVSCEAFRLYRPGVDVAEPSPAVSFGTGVPWRWGIVCAAAARPSFSPRRFFPALDSPVALGSRATHDSRDRPGDDG